MKYFILLLFCLIGQQLFAIKPLPLPRPNQEYYKKGRCAISLTPGFGMEYANSKYSNANIKLLPGVEYFFKQNLSTGLTIGPDFHFIKANNNHHFHFGSTEEIYTKKYFAIGNKRFDKAIFTTLGLNHTIRWNHYSNTNNNSHSKDIEAYIKPFIEVGLAYVISSRFALNASIRGNLNYSANKQGRNYLYSPGFELGYRFTIKYFLN
jgi:hypothetical protein